VEGYTDQLIITLLFDKIGLNIAASGTSIIDVGGKDELAVFYKLSNKLGINCRIIADYDALFRGKLREFIVNDNTIINNFTKEALGTNVANYIGDIQRNLSKIADELGQKMSNDTDIANLIAHLKELFKDKNENIENIRDTVLLGIYKIKDKIKLIMYNPSEIDSVIAKHLKCIQCLESAKIFIIPKGELEHYFKATTFNYLNINDKYKLFHSERDFILGLNKDSVENEYTDILLILKKAIPYIDVDIIKHLRYVIIEWIQAVQNAILRKEVTDISTLKNNARVNYQLYNQIISCIEDKFLINEDGTFSCKIKINLLLIGLSKEVNFDHTTTAQNFKFD
jgi:hypothetical protein